MQSCARRSGAETRSDRVDRIVTHPIWGVPIFLLLMWLVFQLTAHVSAPFLDWIDNLISGPIHPVGGGAARRGGAGRIVGRGADRGRRDRGRGRRGGLRAGAVFPVHRRRRARRLRLYGAFGAGHGPRDACDRAARQELSAADGRVWLQRPGDLRDAHARRRRRPPAHRFSDHVYELRRAAARVRGVWRGVFWRTMPAA